jgi:hypothetical protein
MSTALPGTTRDLWLRNLRDRDKTPITSLGGGESVTFVVLDEDGIEVDSGAGTHISDGNWLASILTPETLGRYKVVWTVVYGNAEDSFVSGFAVTAL